VDPLATALENAVRDLRSTGSDVLVFAFGDPSRRSLTMSRIRGRIAAYNSAVEAIAQQYGCYRVSFWEVAAFDDDRFWDEDRLHLSPAGHELAAVCALSALGLADDGWRTPVVPSARPSVVARAAGHARWTGRHLAPWVVRRLRGESSGDTIVAKHPAWVTVPADGGAFADPESMK